MEAGTSPLARRLMMCKRSSGKAHHKATKFFDFTAPPREKNRPILHKQRVQRAISSNESDDLSNPSDPSDPSDDRLPSPRLGRGVTT